jgi:hypothetical protein
MSDDFFMIDKKSLLIIKDVIRAKIRVQITILIFFKNIDLIK